MYRPRYRSTYQPLCLLRVNRVSTNTLGRESVNISAKWHFPVGRVSVNKLTDSQSRQHRQCVSNVSVNHWSSIGRVLVVYRSTTGIAQSQWIYQPSDFFLSVEYRPIYRPSRPRYRPLNQPNVGNTSVIHCQSNSRLLTNCRPKDCSGQVLATYRLRCCQLQTNSRLIIDRHLTNVSTDKSTKVLASTLAKCW